jgi:LPXTG-site transpeptidase (sortase) family protein
MNPRRIDGIYQRDIDRRYESQRRLVVPARSVQTPPPAPAQPVPAQPLPHTVKPPLVAPPRSLDGMVVVATPVAAAPPVAVQAPKPLSAPEAATQPLVLPEPPSTQPAVGRLRHLRRHLKRAAGAPHQKKRLPPPTRRSLWVSRSFIAAGLLVFLGTGLLGYQTWQANVKARAVFAAPQQALATNTTQTSTNTEQKQGEAIPTEAAVSDKDKATYAVAPDLPRTISIDRIGVTARVLKLGLTKDGAVDAPKGIWDAGWYSGSAKPGTAGNMFIDGHISGPTMPAVFSKLKTLHEGDSIGIERGDGKKLTYKVSTVTTQKLADIDMAKVLAGPGGESLTIMTCGGNYQGNYTYDSRVIVVAKRV